MRNVDIAVEGPVLTVTIRLDEHGQPSASGKSSVIASTSGPMEVPGTDLKLNLSMWRRAGR